MISVEQAAEYYEENIKHRSGGHVFTKSDKYIIQLMKSKGYEPFEQGERMT